MPSRKQLLFVDDNEADLENHGAYARRGGFPDATIRPVSEPAHRPADLRRSHLRLPFFSTTTCRKWMD